MCVCLCVRFVDDDDDDDDGNDEDLVKREHSHPSIEVRARTSRLSHFVDHRSSNMSSPKYIVFVSPLNLCLQSSILSIYEKSLPIADRWIHFLKMSSPSS